MKWKWMAAAAMFLALAGGATAQSTPEFERCVTARHAVFLNLGDPALLEKIKPAPAPLDDASTRRELDELRAIAAKRTDAEAAKAAADDKEMSLFIFRTVFGEQLNRRLLKKTALLSDDVCIDAGLVSSTLKKSFATPRPRPFRADPTLKLACDPTEIFNSSSYPSGHTIAGYLEALTLSEIFPAKREEILERARQYSRNRNVCGVHYPSDVAAGRTAAFAVFEFMKASPVFQSEVNAARDEIRSVWGIDPAKYGAPEKDAAR